MSKLPDFKDREGCWVYRETVKGVRMFTRAGMLYHAMRQRVNSTGSKQIKSPLYVGCTSTFRDFQDFAEWCQTQQGYFEGYQLDKDILKKGNKVYSKDYCAFVPQEINKLFTKRDRCRGALPIGVTMDRNSIRASFTAGGKIEHLGVFSSPESAFAAYKVAKESFIKQQANKFKEGISAALYSALLDYQVEITD